MKKLAASLVVLAGLGLSAPAQSATLDLSSVPDGITGGPDLNLPLAQFHSSLALNVTTRPSGKYVCGLSLSADCRGDFTMNFTLPFVNVSFITTGFNEGDSVLVKIYNGLANIGTQAIGANGLVDLSSFGTITSLIFDDSSDSAGGGASYGNFQINLAASGPLDHGSDVPLPAALPLLLSGIGALGGLRTLRRS